MRHVHITAGMTQLERPWARRHRCGSIDHLLLAVANAHFCTPSAPPPQGLPPPPFCPLVIAELVIPILQLTIFHVAQYNRQPDLYNRYAAHFVSLVLFSRHTPSVVRGRLGPPYSLVVDLVSLASVSPGLDSRLTRGA